jgi:hypothetical protein
MKQDFLPSDDPYHCEHVQPKHKGNSKEFLFGHGDNVEARAFATTNGAAFLPPKEAALLKTKPSETAIIGDAPSRTSLVETAKARWKEERSNRVSYRPASQDFGSSAKLAQEGGSDFKTALTTHQARARSGVFSKSVGNDLQMTQLRTPFELRKTPLIPRGTRQLS